MLKHIETSESSYIGILMNLVNIDIQSLEISPSLPNIDVLN